MDEEAGLAREVASTMDAGAKWLGPWGAVDLSGVHRLEPVLVDGGGDSPIQATRPTLLCEDGAVADAGIVTGWRAGVVAVGNARYRVAEVVPDGAGMTRLVLDGLDNG